MNGEHSAEKHRLIVTLDPITDEDRAEYDAADQDVRADWDRDRRQVNVQCLGVDQSCFGWIECLEDHSDLTEEDEDNGYAVSHGVEHQREYIGWAVENDRCALYVFPDAWCDSATELAEELGVGEHPIDFEWVDEYSLNVYAVGRPSPPGEIGGPQ